MISEPVDDLDRVCLEHDLAYSDPDADLSVADWKAFVEGFPLDPLFGSYFFFQSAVRALMPRNKKTKDKKPAEKAKPAPSKAKIAKRIEDALLKASETPARLVAPPAPKKAMKVKSKSDATGVHVVSHDFALAVAGASETLGSVIATYPLTPESWTGTRLQIFAGLYEKWRLRRASLEWRPAVGTTTAGSFILYHDPDPSDAAGSTGATLVRKAASAKARTEFQVYQPAKLAITPPSGTPPMFTDMPSGSDARLASYGNFFLVNDTPLPTVAALGNLYMTLEIEFQRPILEPVPVSSVFRNFDLFDAKALGLLGSIPTDSVFNTTHGNYFQVFSSGNDGVPFAYLWFQKPGSYMVMFQFEASTTAPSVELTIIDNGDISVVNLLLIENTAPGSPGLYLCALSCTVNVGALHYDSASGRWVDKAGANTLLWLEIAGLSTNSLDGALANVCVCPLPSSTGQFESIEAEVVAPISSTPRDLLTSNACPMTTRSFPRKVEVAKVQDKAAPRVKRV